MHRPRLRVGVLVSGRGTNLQALLDAQGDEYGQGAESTGGGAPDREATKPEARGAYRVVLVCSNRAGVPALERAQRAGVPMAVFDAPHRAAAYAAMGRRLREAQVDLVVLAGFDRILAPEFFAALGDVPCVSTHPSLLPKFGGRGMIGLRVHEAVLAAGEMETGCTIFRTTAGGLDEGEIIAQRRVPVLAGDTPATLEARVLAEEHNALVEVVRSFAATRTASAEVF